MTPQPVETVFARSWELLTRNWIIIVPGLAIGLILGLVEWALLPPAANASGSVASAFATLTSRIILAGLVLAGYIATLAFTTGMAGAAWLRGRATLADGAESFREDAGRIVATTLGLIGLGCVALLLALPTLGLSLLAFVLFTFYAFPAAIVGNRPGLSSISESFSITRRRFWSTLIIAVMIFVISLVVNLIASLFAIAPIVGPLVATVVMQAVVSYAALVVVGEYLTVSGTSSPTATPGSYERQL